MAVLPNQKAYWVLPSFSGPRAILLLTFMGEPVSSEAECKCNDDVFRHMSREPHLFQFSEDSSQAKNKPLKIFPSCLFSVRQNVSIILKGENTETN